jgi:hypothetical protein
MEKNMFQRNEIEKEKLTMKEKAAFCDLTLAGSRRVWYILL